MHLLLLFLIKFKCLIDFFQPLMFEIRHLQRPCNKQSLQNSDTDITIDLIHCFTDVIDRSPAASPRED